jgi:hypothetical protein
MNAHQLISAIRTLPTAAARNMLAYFMGSHNGMRDLYQAFGYDLEIRCEHFFAMYSRNGIAGRIIKAFPKSTWKDDPVIRDEAGDNFEDSPFVNAVEDWAEANNLFWYLERADRLAQIGQYSVLYLGFQGGQPDAPIMGRPKLLFMQPYIETAAQIVEFESDTKSPRYGLPKYYTLQTGNPTSGGGRNSNKGTLRVHHSRVMHFAEILDSDETYGQPVLRPVFNHLKDLEKVLGGSAETFWLNSRPGLALSADAEANLDTAAIADMKQQTEEWEHQLRRVIALQGVTPTQLSAEIADPKPNVEVLLQMIAGGVGMPMRILVGSERGELSSAQDENNWDSRISERRTKYATPRVLKPFGQLMIDTGNWPVPKGEWWVEWPEISTLSESEKANVASIKTTALANYVRSPGAELVVPLEEFRVWLGEEPVSEYETELGEDDQINPVVKVDPNAPPDNDNEEGGSNSKKFNRRSNKVRPRKHNGVITDRRSYRPVYNAAPRSLYVYRQVVNADALIRWAGMNDIPNIAEADSMHVTIMHSRKAVDWMRAGEAFYGEFEIKAGGPRLVEELGTSSPHAVALLFNCTELRWRHNELKELGAEWEWPEYQPHITVSWSDLSRSQYKTIQPYRGKLILGPEVFEEVNDDWKQAVKRNSLSRDPNIRIAL